MNINTICSAKTTLNKCTSNTVFHSKYILYCPHISLNYVDLSLFQYLLKIQVMVFNATFNNISVLSWWSVLLVEETGVPGKNHRPVTSQ